MNEGEWDQIAEERRAQREVDARRDAIAGMLAGIAANIERIAEVIEAEAKERHRERILAWEDKHRG